MISSPHISGVKSPGAGEAEEEEVGEEEEGEVNEGEKAPVKVDSVEVPGEPEKKTEVVDRQVTRRSISSLKRTADLHEPMPSAPSCRFRIA
jgi:hypothetical protein